MYRARDTRLDRDVAIKILPEALRDRSRPARSASSAKRAPSRRAQPSAHLHAPRRRQHDGIDFLVMEFLDGETLADRLRARAAAARPGAAIARSRLPTRSTRRTAAASSIATSSPPTSC